MISNRARAIETSLIGNYALAVESFFLKYYQRHDSYISLSHGNPYFSYPLDLTKIFQEYEESLEYVKNYASRDHLDTNVKQSIMDYFAGEGFDLNEMDVSISFGTTKAIMLCFQLMTETKETILVNAPYYGIFDLISKITGNSILPLFGESEKEYKITSKQLDSIITSHKIKVLLFVNPHNPTGHVYSEDEINALAEVIYKHGVNVIADEVYANLTYDSKLYSLGKCPLIREQVVTLRGFSKDFGLAKERIGIILAHQKLIDKFNYYSQNDSNGTNFFGQLMIQSILKSDNSDFLSKSIKFYQHNLQMVLNYLYKINRSLNLRYMTNNIQYILPINIPASGFFLCLDMFKYCQQQQIKTDIEFLKIILNETAITFLPGCLFGWQPEDCIVRMTYSNAENVMVNSMERLLKYFTNGVN